MTSPILTAIVGSVAEARGVVPQSSMYLGAVRRSAAIGAVWICLAVSARYEGIAEQPASVAEPTGTAQAAPARAVELLPLVNLTRDRIAGRWELQDGILSAGKSGEPVTILLPYEVPEEYSLEVVASRTAAENQYPSLVLGLVVGDHLTTLIIDAEQRSALWPVDGRGWQDNPTTTQPAWQFQDDKPSIVRCTVRKSHVLVEFDGRKLIDFEGDFSRLGAGWEVPRGDRLVLGSLGGHTYRRVTLTPIGEPQALAATDPSVDESDTKSDLPPAWPAAEAMEATRAKIRESLRAEYAAALQPAEQLVLAEKLRQMARASSDDVRRMALCFEAQQQALEAGRVGLAIEILDGIAAEFGVDRLPLTVAFLESLGDEPQSYIYGREIIRLLAPRTRESLVSGRVNLAQQLTEQALKAAKRVNDRTLTSQFEQRVLHLQAIKDAKARVDALRRASDSSPDDAAANLEAGRLLCLLAGDWKSGLTYLARGGDTPLASAARDDLATTDQSSARLETADRWWAIAQQETGLPAQQLLGRAGYWYRLAAPELTGLARAKVDKRLTAVPEDLLFVRLGTTADQQASDRFLSDLMPTELRIFEGLSLLGKPLVVGDIESPNSFLMHPTSNSSAHVAFALPGEYRFLVGKVGMNDSISPSPGQSNSPLTFRVVGDGHLLWQSRPLQIRGDSQKFSVTVAGSEKLELLVDCPGDWGNAHAIWMDCRLTNSPKSKLVDRPTKSRPVDAPKLEILEAKWGGGEHWSDLTANFKALAKDSFLVATSDLSPLSDPTPGWRKHFGVKFRVGEHSAERWFGENELIVLGAVSSPTERDRRKGLVVGRAAYGGGYVWVDITDALRSRIAGSQLKLHVVGDELGIKDDPLVGVRKTLYVQFWFNNQPHLAILHDGDRAFLGQDQ